MPEQKRWPTIREVLDGVERGVIDDRTDGLSALDLSAEEWDEAMADAYAELAKLPDRSRVLEVYSSPEQAALVEQMITAETAEQIEAARQAAAEWLYTHPDDPAIVPVCRFLLLREQQILHPSTVGRNRD